MSRRDVEPLLREAHAFLAAGGVAAGPSKVSRLCRDFLRANPPCSLPAYLVRNLAGISEARRQELIALANQMQTHAAPSTNRGTGSHRHISVSRPL